MPAVSQERLRAARARGQARARDLLAHPTLADYRAYLHDSARCIAGDAGLAVEEVVRRVVDFHRERVEALPDPVRYPELEGARDLLLAEYGGMRDAGVDEVTLALLESLHFWRDIRLPSIIGRACHPAILPEKCRILYVPRTEVGAVHAKNVDDPLTYWKPKPPIPAGTPWPHTHPLFFDGVGSGLHLDEVPPEIFPVKAIELCKEHCTTVEQAREFLVRYNFFWSSQNLLVHDRFGNSVAFEKTRCRVATRGPDARGRSFISGMGALDPALRAFQDDQRKKYLEQRKWDDDCPDARFWRMCRRKYEHMARYVAALSDQPTLGEINELMERRDPDGPLCLTGVKCHPDEVAPGCTLEMRVWLVDRKQYYRRQWRGTTPAWLDAPEFVQFASDGPDPSETEKCS